MSDGLSFTELAKLNEDEARELLEELRWPSGPVCPHCGFDEAYVLTAKPGSKRPVRKGVYKCKKCRKQYTVTVGTVFEGSRIPLNKWVMAISLMCASKKGISAHQLHRMLSLTYKTAWFMCHRIRHAMSEGPLAGMLQGTIEADETYIGGKAKGKRGRGAAKKAIVLTLIERDGRARSTVTESVTAATLLPVIKENVARNATIMTDELGSYNRLGLHFKRHGKVTHSQKKYARDDVHVNAAEGFFALLKRGVHGTFHHVGKQHLDKYLGEFDFRWSTRTIGDRARTAEVIKRVSGKRLYYKK